MESNQRNVLITTSIIATIQPETDLHRILGEISDQLLSAVDSEFQTSANIETSQTSSFHCLDEPEANCDRCARCECWMTNGKKPDAIPGLPNGSIYEEKPVCDICLPLLDGTMTG